MESYQPVNYNQIPNTFQVVKSFMVDSGTHNTAYTRPYTANPSSDVLHEYETNTRGGTQVNRGSLATIASKILSPSTEVEAIVNVPNGWNEHRILFMMEIYDNATRMAAVLMGYADKVDLSLRGTIDPELRLYINSTMTLASTDIQTPHGVQTRRRVVNSGNLLGKQVIDSIVPLNHGSFPVHPYSNGMLAPQYAPPPTLNTFNNRVYLQRPMDVANNLSLGYMAHSSDAAFADGRTQLMLNNQIHSKRSNTNAPTYLAEVVNTLRNTLNDSQIINEASDHASLFMESAELMSETTIMNDPVQRYIARNSNIMQQGFVTWGQLCHMFPDMNTKTDYFPKDGDPLQLNGHFQSEVGRYADWNNASWEPIIATTVFNALPGIISNYMLTGVAGTMTNNTLDGQYEITLTDVRSFVEVAHPNVVQQIEFRILSEVMPGLTLGNQRLVHINFNINLVRDGWVSVSLEGGPAIEFSQPCYADSLMLPTIASSPDALGNLASTINALVRY